MFRVINEKNVYTCPIFQVIESRVESRTGGEMTVSKVASPDWVNVIPSNKDGKLLLIRQFRYGSSRLSWEFPGGMVDGVESPETAALRELEEETGWKAGKITSLGACCA